MRHKASLTPWFSDKVPSSLGFLDFAGGGLGLTAAAAINFEHDAERVDHVPEDGGAASVLLMRTHRGRSGPPAKTRSWTACWERVWALLLLVAAVSFSCASTRRRKRKSRRLAQPSGVPPIFSRNQDSTECWWLGGRPPSRRVIAVPGVHATESWEQYCVNELGGARYGIQASKPLPHQSASCQAGCRRHSRPRSNSRRP